MKLPCSCTSILASALAAAIALITPSRAEALTYLVTNTNDAGTGSLRQKIADAATNSTGPHTIYFDIAANSTITLASRITIPNGLVLTIDATAPTGISLDGNGSTRLIQVGDGARVSIKGLTLRNGYSNLDAGGCISSPNSTSTLRLEAVFVLNCVSFQPSGSAFAGAVYAYSPLTIIDSRFEDNRVRNDNGSAYGGAIMSTGALEITNTSFFGNEASAHATEAGGGAIEARAGGRFDRVVFVGNASLGDSASVRTIGGAVRSRTTSEIRVVRSLLVGNSAQQGAAIEVQNAASAFVTRLFIRDSQIVGNFGGIATSLLNVSSDIRNTTFWKNDGGNQSAAHLLYGGAQTVVDAFTHNLLAPVAGNAPACDLANLPVAAVGGGRNLFPDSSCSALATDSTVWTGDFRIRALRRPVGDPAGMPAVELFAGSPALDAGKPLPVDPPGASDCTTTDVRGQARPQDADADGQAACDIGALETVGEASLFADDFEVPLLR
ncbi:choice-of-anchor Q domain-containing protein [Dokdonella sp.]|uniref:choice-of-anchor Q domain-containing protein n=1 Tax=Dokdonella sp. TaxID=2291710 RepID=UPI0027BA8399|nr:choice-of-anchor Q domain-containing protein [Dokdonella sp.]